MSTTTCCRITPMNNYNPDAQRLFFDDLINCRELGGMPGSDGAVFKKGILLRSGSPSLASKEAYKQMKEFGVRTVIDLRSKAELEHYGNPFNDGVTHFYNIPLFVGDPDSEDDPTMKFLETHPMGEFYVMMVQVLGHEIVDILRIIIKETDGYILFHCAHGKDRTGVVCAILYLLIGASVEDIVLNYKVSYEYAKHFLDPLIADRVDNMKHTLRSDAENMVILLNYFKEKYDLNIADYLRENGMKDEEIDLLKARITA